jgi:hypothetical protein
MGEPASGGEPVSVFESGESLLYWGEITGQFFGPRFAIAQNLYKSYQNLHLNLLAF